MSAPRRGCVLFIVDGLSADMLSRAMAAGRTPTLSAIAERGRIDLDCTGIFPSITAPSLASLITGELPVRTGIPNVRWWHREEGRFVEYGQSMASARVTGFQVTLRDLFVNLNHLHLSPGAETLFESVEDAGLRAASVNFTVHRGRRRHTLRRGVLHRRLILASGIGSAVWGPTDMVLGELYGSFGPGHVRTFGALGRMDRFAVIYASELLGRADGERPEFALVYLPDVDHITHRVGPAASGDAIAGADRAIADIAEAAGGLEAFLDRYAVVVTADHGHDAVHADADLRLHELLTAAGIRAARRRRHWGEPVPVRLAAAGRAAQLWLTDAAGAGPGRTRLLNRIVRVLGEHEETDLIAHRDPTDPRVVVVHREGAVLRARPDGRSRDPRGNRWSLRGDLSALGLDRDGWDVDSADFPDGLRRLAGLLGSTRAGDIAVSARPGFEYRDVGNAGHPGGGSHGSLHRVDSMVPLLTCGLDAMTRGRPSITDVAGLVRAHFGIAAGNRRSLAATPGAPARAR
jgi:hypothetical protein